MNAHETEKNGLTVILYFYSETTWTREELILFLKEETIFSLDRERLETVFPITVKVTLEEQVIRINGSKIEKEGFLLWETKEKEQILIVASGRKEQLLPCGRLLLKEGCGVTLGKAYQNEIFYCYASFLQDRHIRIFHGEDGIWMTCPAGGETGQLTGIYINKQAAASRELLKKGDSVELFGLTVLVLPEMLVCSAAYGSLRAAEKKRELPVWKPEGKREILFLPAFLPAEERELHREEIELELPEPERETGRQPLILTLGPAFTMMLPMLLMSAAGSVLLGQSGEYYQLSLIMAVSSALLSVFWGIVQGIYYKRVSRRERKRKREHYREYLQKVEDYVTECMGENREILERRFPSKTVFLQEQEKVRICTSQTYRDRYFIRLGTGDIPNQIQLHLQGKKRELNQDILTEEAFALTRRLQILTGAPAGITLGNAGWVGFTGEKVYSVLLQAILQLAAHYRERNLKIVLFYQERNKKEQELAACVKWLPQLWSENGSIRFLAGNEKEAGEILPFLTEELCRRKEKGETEVFYLFLVANEELVRGEGLYSFLKKEKQDEGLCTVFVHRRREMLPGSCDCLVACEREKGEIAVYEKGIWKKQKIQLEECSVLQAENYMRRMAGAMPQTGRAAGRISEKISFLNLFFCQSTQELCCLQRWQENRTRDRIKVPVGVGDGGRLLYLDIHEKFHGPHGIVAGTTGSGKSELLQTYLLSLSVSFSPEEVSFFIIDYKGGGMGNSLNRLPHCAGVVSNLSGRQIRRALCAIKSENVRRQKVFAQAKVNHIEEYSLLYKKGEVKQPVPHLILVVDEFAELKKEEPDFMQEIISLAQVGRSLGVHLILATQKPSGTVDDKIWSNTRFRLCLRVAERQDSLDMLHKPEAAYLTSAGQCYLQVGNDEIFELFQAGYCKAPYVPEEKEGESVFLVSVTGKRIFEKQERNSERGNQLEAVTGYLNQIIEQTDYRRAAQLWLPELPERISLQETEQRKRQWGETGEEAKEYFFEQEEVRLCLGLCDDAERQEQYAAYYSPVEQGNLCLCGGPAVGKSTFLQTLLWQFCTKFHPAKVRFLLAASDSSAVNAYEAMPHCMGNLKTEKDADCFFFQLTALFEERKRYFEGIPFTQHRKNGTKQAPCLFFLIDGYGAFRRLTDDRYREFMGKLAEEGNRYGIYLIFTALGAGSGELPAAMLEKMKVMLCLEMSEAYRYGEILRQHRITILPEEGKKGRGLCKIKDRVLEFQIPLFDSEADDCGRIKKIQKLAEQIESEQRETERQKKFRRVPEQPDYGQMCRSFFGGGAEKGRLLPIGYDVKSGKLCSISLQESISLCISGRKGSGKRNLLYCLVHGLTEAGRNVVVLDGDGRFTHEELGKRLVISKQKEEWESLLKEADKRNERRFCFCICSPAAFAGIYERHIARRSLDRENRKRQENREFDMLVLLLPGEEAGLVGTALREELEDGQKGIHLGGGAGNQRLLSFDDISYGQLEKREEAGMGYFKNGQGTDTLRVLIPVYGKVEKDNDFSGCAGSLAGPDV